MPPANDRAHNPNQALKKSAYKAPEAGPFVQMPGTVQMLMHNTFFDISRASVPLSMSLMVQDGVWVGRP
jgi:hypothetical protein